MILSSTHIPATTHNPVQASSNRSETSATVTPWSTGLTSSKPEISTALTSWSSSTSFQHTTNPNSPTPSLSTSAPSVPAWQTHHQQSSTMPQTSLEPTLMVSLSVSPPSPSTCYPAPITNLQASNVTGSSFCVSWMTGQSQSRLSFLVVLMEGSKVRGRWETGLSVWEVTLLKPGVLYNVTVIPCPYGSQGASLLLLVKTAAQTLGATARLTNMQFTDALLDPTSQEYQNLSRSIEEEILQSLPPDILALVNSGDVRFQIIGLAPGSVVVNFTIIFTPSQSQDILNGSSALMQALQNSSRYTVDRNNTSIDDVDECSTGDMDCSPWALCTNTWGSYSCLCLDGFTDSNPSRPGRGCSAPLTTTTTTPMSITTAVQTTTAPATTTTTTTTNTPVTTNNTVSTTTTYNTTSITTNNTDAATMNSPVTTTANNTVRINNTVSTKTVVTITTMAPVTTSTTTEVPTTTTSGLIKTSLQPETPTSLAPLVSYTEAISVECRPSAITVTVARDFLWAGHIGDSSLFLGRQECGVNGGNSSHVQLTVAWDECNTQLLHHSLHCSGESVQLYELSALARRHYKGFHSTAEGPHHMYDMIKDAVMGSGTFHVMIQLLSGMSPLPQNHSMSPEEDVVVEVSVDSTVAQIKVVINKCWATQSSNPLEPTTNVFLENSCPLPNTYTTVVENGNSSKSRLSLRIFSYVNLNVIYLHCQIQICIETGSATCQPCPSKRELILFVCLLGIGLFLLFIGSLSSLFFYHRKRIGTYSFSLKPKQDNFTYHVFDT
ncbi:unnamed protein product [Coregonus sp. 'balchen']|nr:unnamed protein product [Coregonus sp. 'balchen']